MVFEQAHVIVTTTSIAGQCEPEAQQAMAALCGHLFIDEAHHAEATTWKALRESFASTCASVHRHAFRGMELA